jgi:hypothetical protein
MLNYHAFPLPKLNTRYQWGGGSPFVFTRVTPTAVSYRFADGTEVKDANALTFRHGLASRSLRELQDRP